MRPIVLDTDVASRLRKHKLNGHLLAQVTGREQAVTFITYGELVKWGKAHRWSLRRRHELDGWLEQRETLLGDEAVADTWGDLAADAERRGRPRADNDMWIAACCLTHDLPLATLNLKDFGDFRDHHGLRIVNAG